MKYIFVVNLVVFNLKHTKIKKVCGRMCVWGRGRGGKGGARNPPGSQVGASLEKFGDHWSTVSEH